jgi:hypothetical protein
MTISMRQCRIFVVSTLALAAGVAACTDRGAAYADQKDAIYRVLLDTLRWAGPDTLLFRDSTAVFSVDEGGSLFKNDSTAGLFRELKRVSARRRATTSLGLPGPIRVITDAEQRELFRDGPNEGWTEFGRLFPNQKAVVQISQIAFSEDGLEAVVYYGYSCGGRCGATQAAWLERHPGGAWRVRKVFVLSMS